MDKVAFSDDIVDEVKPCIYGLLHPETMELRYIGKAKDPKARLESHMRDSRRRNTPVYCWIRKVGRPVMVILSDQCYDWKCEEQRLIKKARQDGVRLLNLADGGNEPSCTKDVRARNGAMVAKLRVSTPQKKHLYELRRSLGQMLASGFVAEHTKTKMRQLAKTHPSMFSSWSEI